MTDTIAFPALIGDIGGTNARFALIEHAGTEPERLATAQTADYATIDDAIAAVLAAHTGAKPKSAVLALAGPIRGDRVPLTNCPWVVEPKKTIARFGLTEMVLINDFEAQSLSLPGLTAADLDQIGGGTMTPQGPRVVIGPGTGLGAGGLVHTGSIWVPIPGEGGHIGLGPVSERDFAIWPHLERETERVSAENVLCGPGMVRLYQAIVACDGSKPKLDTPEAITAAGVSGADRQARETLEVFATHLGRASGDVALIFMAYGGVYLAGGITGRIATILKSGGFRAGFLDKWPHEALMDRMATSIIVKTDAALAGIAAFTRAPGSFGVELAGRHWRG